MISSRKIAQTLIELLEKGYSPDDVARQCAILLREYNISAQQERIISYLRKYARQMYDQKTVYVETSHALADESINRIKKIIEAGKDAPVSIIVDGGLVGGFRSVYKNKAYDATIRTKLKKLHRFLITN